MAAPNYARLMKLREAKGPAAARAALAEAFQAKEITPRDVDLGQLFAGCFGWHAFQECRAGRSLVSDVIALAEAEGAVSTDTFRNVSGQFAYQTVLDAYQMEEGVFTALIPEAPASTLDGEKIPGLTEIGDELSLRPEGQPYGLAGIGENWVFTPPIPDYGMIVAATWESFFNDKTGQLGERLADVGKWAKVRREKAAIDFVIDQNRASHRYNWRNAGPIQTYDDNTGAHTWDNLVAGNELVDWKNIDLAKQAFYNLRDPFTGEPIRVNPRHLVHTPSIEATVHRVLHATEIRVATPGYATTGSPTQTNVPNPYVGMFTPVTSRLLADRLAVDTDWFLGDIGKLGKCMMAEKMNVAQAAANNKDEFERRIVQQYRVNEMFAYVTVEPRAMVKNKVAA